MAFGMKFGEGRSRDLFVTFGSLIAAAIGLAVAALWIPVSYLASFCFGTMVGAGELVSRYRDAPEEALRTTPALLYMLLNAGASCAAFALIIAYGVIPGSGDGPALTRVMLAGFGAMAFFRTSLFTVRVGDQDISIGPSAFLQIVLRASDRAVDRLRASARAAAVATSMAGVSFSAAQSALPSFCMALMQNLSADEQNDLADSVKVLQASTTMDDQTKAKNLGLLLMNFVGDVVLRDAVANLASQIKTVMSVTIKPPSLTLKQGAVDSVTAVCQDSTGTPIPARVVTWASADPAIATVGVDGRVRGIAQGTTTITATADQASDAIPVTVTP